jgi:hypothetical protein
LGGCLFNEPIAVWGGLDWIYAFPLHVQWPSRFSATEEE